MESYLRFQTHSNGHQIKILYAFDCRWSKTLRDKNDETAWKLLIDAVKERFGGTRFLWIANKDVRDSLFPNCDGQVRLPNFPHGINEYKDRDNIALLSATNPSPSQIAFMNFLGLNSDEITQATYHHSLYQAVMRCSIRDPENINSKTIIVPSRSAAEFLQSLFPGSQIESLGLELDDRMKPLKRGRPAKHSSHADRQKAYRARMKGEQQLLNEFSVLSDSAHKALDETQDLSCTNERDEILLYNPDDISVTRFHGTIYGQKTDARPAMHLIAQSHDEFIALLRILSKSKYQSKDDNRLLSPACYQGIDGVSTHRARENFVSANGIWLDFDSGNLTPRQFSEIFPQLRIVCFNTWSSSSEQLRFRAYIPTASLMTLEEYKLITKQIHKVLVDNGYAEKCNPEEPKQKAHGLDLGKLTPIALFYLPCRAEQKNKSFFTEFRHGRAMLDPKEWVQYSVIDIDPVFESVPISPFEPLTDDQIEKIDEYRREFEAVGVMPGNGDEGLSTLAGKLWKSRVRGPEFESILMETAKRAHSPIDRIKQVKRITRWYRN